jgi:outer membrane protein OmpA-like peptidoglycan-associated protein
MRTQLIFISILLAIVASPTLAQAKTSKEENVGAGVGATVGALAGGPIGLILGAAAGAKIGDLFNNKGEQIALANQSAKVSQVKVTDLQNDRAELQRDNQELRGDIDRLQALARPELLSLMQAGIEMDLLFRTDEHVLADTTDTRLNQLAGSLAGMTDVQIQLDGFADERGDAAYNQQLSEKRVAYVKNLLLTNGVVATRINVAAHGESPATDSNVDSYALQRKVSLTLFIGEQNSFAATP